ncbi:hypothetical protein QT971_21430 [Microcoleus sp. herbarium19]|uniref:hypothetical protein n=1 Tax=Microcoleus sp. herbarium13 TaxID=3055438 RepID=UPI002FD0B87F
MLGWQFDRDRTRAFTADRTACDRAVKRAQLDICEGRTRGFCAHFSQTTASAKCQEILILRCHLAKHRQSSGLSNPARTANKNRKLPYRNTDK